MADAFVIKTLNGYLIPAFDSDKEIVNKIKAGEPRKITITNPRNYQFHKKYMALLNLAFSNQEKAKDFNEFRKDIIIEAGYFFIHIDLNGKEVKKAKSMSFAKMDDIEFSGLYSKTIDVIIEKILKGNTKEEINEEIDIKMKEIINFM